MCHGKYFEKAANLTKKSHLLIREIFSNKKKAANPLCQTSALKQAKQQKKGRVWSTT